MSDPSLGDDQFRDGRVPAGGHMLGAGKTARNRDANDMLREDGPESIRAAIRKAKPIARDHNSRPSIQIRAGDLHNLATEAEDALLQSRAPIFVRGDALFRPIVEEVDAVRGGKTNVARLKMIDKHALVDHLSRAARFEKFNARKEGYVPADPPENVATTLLSRDGEWRFRRIAGVITTPTLRPDGTILSAPGFDPDTRLLLIEPPELPPIPDRPTKRDAKLALADIAGLLVDFPFTDLWSRAVALSMMITPIVRGAMRVAPMHVATAPAAGTGKSYLADIACAILTGDRLPALSPGKSEEEFEKRLGAVLMAGQAIISLDNVNGELGGDFLCQAIDRPVVSTRVLGLSKVINIESRTTIFANGNNIHLVGDLTRRVVLCSLDAKMERPELRAFHSDPVAIASGNRGKYIAAALTIARAYIVAGCPSALAPLASFEDWSRVVRSALVWLGEADPVETMAKARAEDPTLGRLSALLATWSDAVGASALTAGGIVAAAAEHPEWREALMEIAGDNRGGISPFKLSPKLRHLKGRIINGLKLESDEDGHLGQKVWRVRATN